MKPHPEVSRAPAGDSFIENNPCSVGEQEKIPVADFTEEIKVRSDKLLFNWCLSNLGLTFLTHCGLEMPNGDRDLGQWVNFLSEWATKASQ